MPWFNIGAIGCVGIDVVRRSESLQSDHVLPLTITVGDVVKIVYNATWCRTSERVRIGVECDGMENTHRSLVPAKASGYSGTLHGRASKITNEIGQTLKGIFRSLHISMSFGCWFDHRE